MPHGRRILVALLLALALPQVATAQDPVFLDATDVPIGNDWATLSTQLEPGTTYRIVVSGQVRYELPNGESETWDAAYCTVSTKRSCDPPKRQALFSIYLANFPTQIPLQRLCTGQRLTPQGLPYQPSHEYSVDYAACVAGPVQVRLGGDAAATWTGRLHVRLFRIDSPPGLQSGAPPGSSGAAGPTGAAGAPSSQGFVDIARSQPALSRGSIALSAQCPVDCVVEGVARLGRRVVGALDTRLSAGRTRSMRLRLSRAGRRLLRRKRRATGRAPVVNVVITLLAADGEQTIRTTVRVR
jgi:hypothetical protein